MERESEEKKTQTFLLKHEKKIARKTKKSLTPIQSNTNGSSKKKKETKGKKLLGKIM